MSLFSEHWKMLKWQLCHHILSLLASSNALLSPFKDGPTTWTDKTNITINEGQENVTLPCPVCGHPQPTITNVVWSIDRKIRGGENGIFIYYVGKTMSGPFTCAIDDDHNVTATIYVIPIQDSSDGK